MSDVHPSLALFVGTRCRFEEEEARLRLGITTAAAELTVVEHEMSRIAEAEEEIMARASVASMEHAAATRSVCEYMCFACCASK